MNEKELFIALSRQCNGNWEKIFKMIKEKEAPDPTLTTTPEDCVAITDPEYPSNFKAALRPPFLLYLKGDKSLLNAPKRMFVMGDKKERLSSYQKQWCLSMVQYAVKNDDVIVTIEGDYMISLCQQYGCKCICSYNKLPDRVPDGFLGISEMTHEMTGDPGLRPAFVGMGLGKWVMMLYAASKECKSVVALGENMEVDVFVLPCDSEDIGVLLEDGAIPAVHPDFVWEYNSH